MADPDVIVRQEFAGILPDSQTAAPDGSNHNKPRDVPAGVRQDRGGKKIDNIDGRLQNAAGLRLHGEQNFLAGLLGQMIEKIKGCLKMFFHRQANPLARYRNEILPVPWRWSRSCRPAARWPAIRQVFLYSRDVRQNASRADRPIALPVHDERCRRENR